MAWICLAGSGQHSSRMPSCFAVVQEISALAYQVMDVDITMKSSATDMHRRQHV